MLVIIRAALVVATAWGTALTLAACSGSSRQASYLAVKGSNVNFIQWEPSSGSSVHGTVTVASVAGTVPRERLSRNTHRFTGTIHGSSVSLTVSGFRANAKIHGTLNAGALTIQVPQANRRIQHANSLADRARGQARRRHGQASPEVSLRVDVATLQQDASSASGNFGGNLSSFASDIQRAGSDLAAEKLAAAGSNKYCSTTATVAGKAQAVHGDLKSVKGDVKALTSDRATVQRDITTVEGDLRTLSAKRLRAPSGAAARAAVAAARTNIRGAITRANGYIDQMNMTYAQAYSFAHGKATGRCSGHGPGRQAAPIPHIRLLSRRTAGTAAGWRPAREHQGLSRQALPGPRSAGPSRLGNAH